MAEVPIGPGTRVTLKFSLLIIGGEVIDEADSATFEVGDGSLLPGFESAIFGMRGGESGTVEIKAKNGFGEPNEDNVHKMKQVNFGDIELVEGLVVSFEDAEGRELAGVVKELDDDVVTVDFNHPLAGRDLLFQVEIFSVEKISNVILRG